MTGTPCRPGTVATGAEVVAGLRDTGYGPVTSP
jgi:hypothetical protein